MSWQDSLPRRHELYYGGEWHPAKNGRTEPTLNPANNQVVAEVSYAGSEDMDAAVAAAKSAFPAWRDTPPLARAKYLKRIAEVMRKHKEELALVDAVNSGNPISAMIKDVDIATAQLDYFAGLVLEMKGDTIPMGPEAINYTLREPLGVVGRIVAFNHPLMFCAAKAAAPLAAGNTVVMKPAEQAPLSVLRLMELIEGILPPGVLNIAHGGAEAGQALANHPDVAKIGLIGSVPTGKAVMASAATTIKDVILELGGKNALIVCPDADLDKAARGIVAGMNFAWCGQSCGSTSRALLHSDIHDEVLEKVAALLDQFVPGDPTSPQTTMGALISKQQAERVIGYIEGAKSEGARLVTGGKRPDESDLQAGNFVEPTIFADVTPDMTIAREEIFGPVLAVMTWHDEQQVMDMANNVEFGLTCSIWTKDLARAHKMAAQAEAGFVWINKSAAHFLGAPFGGVKQSGIGREECLGEMLGFTREKNIHVALD